MPTQLDRDGTEIETTDEAPERHNWRPHDRSGPKAGWCGEDDDGRQIYCTGCRPHLRQLKHYGPGPSNR